MFVRLFLCSVVVAELVWPASPVPVATDSAVCCPKNLTCVNGCFCPGKNSKPCYKISKKCPEPRLDRPCRSPGKQKLCKTDAQCKCFERCCFDGCYNLCVRMKPGMLCHPLNCGAKKCVQPEEECVGESCEQDKPICEDDIVKNRKKKRSKKQKPE